MVSGQDSSHSIRIEGLEHRRQPFDGFRRSPVQVDLNTGYAFVDELPECARDVCYTADGTNWTLVNANSSKS